MGFVHPQSFRGEDKIPNACLALAERHGALCALLAVCAGWGLGLAGVPQDLLAI
jgi:hypothetical protein